MKSNSNKPAKHSPNYFQSMAFTFCLIQILFFATGLDSAPVFAASSEQSEVAPTSRVVPESGANGRQVDLQFGGSLCPVCLNAFKIRLGEVVGVKTVEIKVDKINPKSGHPPKLAHAFVAYDPEKISQDNLIEMIKRNDFQFFTAKEIVSTETDEKESR